MLIRQTTDHQSPLAVEKRGPGFRVSILGSAVGLCYLAYCPKEQRDSLLDILAKSNKEADKAARNRKKVLETLVEVRKRGYAISHRKRRVSEELSFAVPIIANDRLLAALGFRCSSTAVPETDAIQRFVPKVTDVARQIGDDFVNQQDRDAIASRVIAPIDADIEDDD